MCDHSKRPKLFCILDTCTANQCFACSQCLKRLHAACGQENLIEEKDISALLSRYELPHQIKQVRRNCNIKIYNLLTRIKSEISNKLEEMFSSMMSKIKYPFLFHNQFLEIYRNIRDKNYQRLKKQKLSQFYKFSERLVEPEFLSKEQQYYNCYLFQNENSINTLSQKISALEHLFQFKIHKDVATLHQDCMNEIKSYKQANKNVKDNKNTVAKLAEKIKKELYPQIQSKNRLEFRTPKKSHEKLDISIDQMTLKTPSHDPSKKNQNYNDQMKSSINSRLSSMIDKSNSSEENVQIVNAKISTLFQTKTSKSFNQSLSNSFINKQQSLTGLAQQGKILKNQLGDETFCNSYDYNEQNQKMFHIKISTIKRDSLNDRLQQEQNKLSKSTQIKPQKSQNDIPVTEKDKKRQCFQDKIMSVIKEREQNVKKRLDDLKKQRENVQNEPNIQQSQRLASSIASQKKPTDEKKGVNGPLSKKESTKKSQIQLSVNDLKESKTIVRQVNSAMTYFQKKDEEKQSKILKNQPEQKSQCDRKQTKEKSPRKPIQETQNKGKIEILQTPNTKYITKKYSVQRFDNVSLSKQVPIKQKFITKQTQNPVNTKQIPFIQTSRSQSPKKSKLQKKLSLNVSSEEEFQAACLYFVKMKSMKDKDKNKEFLEKYTQKYENNITAIQYLTYNYLQEGKPKECLTICNKYLQKLQALPLNEEHKLNLIINKSAALNMLSRQTETIPYLHHKLQLIEHQKMYKNLGDAYYNKGITDKAIYNYEKAIKLNSKYDEAFYNLAVMLYIQKSYFNAKMNIDKAIACSNKNQQYQQLLFAIEQRIKMNS